MHSHSKILIVDDMDNARQALSRLLELSGYQTAEADNAETALEKLDSESFALTIMDLRMPGMSGLEAARRISSRNRNHPIILMSGCTEDDIGMERLPVGIRGFLCKPINPDTLISEVEKALRD